MSLLKYFMVFNLAFACFVCHPFDAVHFLKIVLGHTVFPLCTPIVFFFAVYLSSPKKKEPMGENLHEKENKFEKTKPTKAPPRVTKRQPKKPKKKSLPTSSPAGSSSKASSAHQHFTRSKKNDFSVRASVSNSSAPSASLSSPAAVTVPVVSSFSVLTPSVAMAPNPMSNGLFSGVSKTSKKQKVPCGGQSSETWNSPINESKNTEASTGPSLTPTSIGSPPRGSKKRKVHEENSSEDRQSPDKKNPTKKQRSEIANVGMVTWNSPINESKNIEASTGPFPTPTSSESSSGVSKNSNKRKVPCEEENSSEEEESVKKQRIEDCENSMEPFTTEPLTN